VDRKNNWSQSTNGNHIANGSDNGLVGGLVDLLFRGL
jgi:hypothetical protein